MAPNTVIWFLKRLWQSIAYCFREAGWTKKGLLGEIDPSKRYKLIGWTVHQTSAVGVAGRLLV